MKPFQNTKAPAYLTDWAIRNLNAGATLEEFEAAVTKSRNAWHEHEDAAEMNAVLTNFLADFKTHTKDEMLKHYTALNTRAATAA